MSGSSNPFDLKAILVSVITSAIVGLAPMIYMLGQMDTRIQSLEQAASKTDKLTDTIQGIKENVAVIATDVSYVKENVRDLKSNSDALSKDLQDVRAIVNQNNGVAYDRNNKPR